MKKEYQILHKSYSKLQKNLAIYELHFNTEENQIKQYKQLQQQNYFNKRNDNEFSDDETNDVEIICQKQKKNKNSILSKISMIDQLMID